MHISTTLFISSSLLLSTAHGQRFNARYNHLIARQDSLELPFASYGEAPVIRKRVEIRCPEGLHMMDTGAMACTQCVNSGLMKGLENPVLPLKVQTAPPPPHDDNAPVSPQEAYYESDQQRGASRSSTPPAWNSWANNVASSRSASPEDAGEPSGSSAATNIEVPKGRCTRCLARVADETKTRPTDASVCNALQGNKKHCDECRIWSKRVAARNSKRNKKIQKAKEATEAAASEN